MAEVASQPNTADLLITQATALAKKVHTAAIEAGREDLVKPLREELARSPTAPTTVVVCGETNRGKSALINALLDSPGLLPVAAERSTGTHVVVRSPQPGEVTGVVGHGASGELLPIPLEELDDWVTDGAPIARDIRWVEIILDHPLLASGMTLVDSPGVGGLSRAHGQIVLSVLAGSEAGLMVVDGGAPISAPELDFLAQALERVDDLVVALNRIDAQQGWQVVMSETKALLERQAPGRVSGSVFPVSARMKSRADRLGDPNGPPESLSEELENDSGVPLLARRLGWWAGSRSGAFRAARLCRASERVIQRLRALERETVVTRDASDQELAARLERKTEARTDLARTLPTTRRHLANDFRLLQREVDASATARVTSLRREFDRRVAEGKVTNVEDDVEAELLKALQESQSEVVERLEAAERTLLDALKPFDVALQFERSELSEQTTLNLNFVDAMPLKGGTAELLGRASMTFGAALFNPLYAVAGLGGLLFDRGRMKRRARQDQLARQITETLTDARGEVSLLVHHAVVNGQAVLTDAFEEAVVIGQQELDEEIAALRARSAQSQSERASGAAGAAERLTRLEALATQVSDTRRAAAELMGAGLPA